MKSNRRKSKRKKQNILLLISCLIFMITACCFAILESYKTNNNKGSKSKGLNDAKAQNIIDSSADEENVLATVNSANRGYKDNSLFATGDYAGVYDYLYSVTKVENRGLDMKLSGDGYYKMYGDNSAEFKVLQITDMHITGTESTYLQDIKALQTTYSMIQKTHPDFIILTGDIIFGTGVYDANDGIRALNVVSNFMDNIGIPWTWAFGNHDHEFFDQYPEEVIASLVSQSITLRMYRKNQEITGYTNGTYELCNSDGTVAMGLIIMDSGNMIQNEDGTYGYDYIKDDQVFWYEQQIGKLNAETPGAKSMVFFHIPLQEYNNAWNSGILAFGNKREDVFCSFYHSELFEKARLLGSTVAMFCGHDHLNDYGAYYNGIELVYGKSIDYIAYQGIEQQTEQRGATLINISANGIYRIEQQLANP